MKRLFIIGAVAAIAFLALEFCPLALAQHEGIDRKGNTQASPSGLTGAGAGDGSTTAKQPTGAGDLGNPLLGGMRHPLYRLQPSDVVEVSFTVAPEFNQTLTVQPDGYVMLKDAGLVEAQGLNLAEFGAAVEKAYRGYLHDPQAAVALK